MVTRSILRPVLRPVTRAVSDTIRGFNPRSLFASGEQGVWLDPSDFSTLFQDALGAVPVTAAGQTVILAKDKSGRGNHVTLTNVVLGINADGFYHFKTNGTSSFGVTGNIDFSGTDKLTIFAGVRKITDAATGTVCEFSSNAAATPGSFWFVVRSTKRWSAGSYGTVLASNEAGQGNAPETDVVTISYDISAPRIQQRIDGQEYPAGVGTQGTGNYGNFPLFIGAKNGTSSFFNGEIYQLVVRGSASTASEIQMAERIIARKTYKITPTDLFIVTGQSNAEGRGTSGPAVAAGRAYYFASGTRTSLLGDPVGGANTGSAWPAFANAYYSQKGIPSAWVDQATGGSGLIAASNPSFNWSTTGTLRATARNAAIAAVSWFGKSLDTPLRRTYIIWQQGEQDSATYNGTTISDVEYQAELGRLFTYFSQGLPALSGILVSELGAHRDGVGAANWNLIRAAQNAGVAENDLAYLAFTGAKNFPAQGKMSDTVHYNQAGYDEMGAALATYAASLL